jgi:hypothetical protein
MGLPDGHDPHHRGTISAGHEHEQTRCPPSPITARHPSLPGFDPQGIEALSTPLAGPWPRSFNRFRSGRLFVEMYDVFAESRNRGWPG